MVRTKADIRATYDRIAESFAARRREPWPEVRSFIELRRVLRRGAPVFLSVWSREQPRFQSIPPAPEIDGDVEVPWTMPDKTVVPRFYHLFQRGELERLIIGSGLHGERFFPGAGNWFAEARSNG